jgi:hypothetical protein
VRQGASPSTCRPEICHLGYLETGCELNRLWDKRVLDVNLMEQSFISDSMDTQEVDALGLDAFNPILLKAAQNIYSNYCQCRMDPQQPVGVAIDRDTHRGHLIFAGKPILLPQECFVPFSDLELLEVA